MILLLDIGNSRIKWAVWDGTALTAHGAAEHRGDPAATSQAQEWPKVRSVWVSSVCGTEQDNALSERIKARYGFPPSFVRTQAEWSGLKNAYAEYQRLGVDRWLAMVGAWKELHGPFCIVNAGTALTFDAVDNSGRHLGGLIAPGLATMQRALLDATRFPTRTQKPPYTIGLGKDTESCVQQGPLHACIGLIEHASRDLAGKKLIAGGDAPTLLPHLAKDWSHRPNLVLEGLLAVALDSVSK